MSASTFPDYPKSTDCSDGIMVSLLMRSITSARKFVTVERGASDGSVPIMARASSNITSGVHIGLHAGYYSGRVLLGSVLQGIMLIAIAVSAIIGLISGRRQSEERRRPLI